MKTTTRQLAATLSALILITTSCGNTNNTTQTTQPTNNQPTATITSQPTATQTTTPQPEPEPEVSPVVEVVDVATTVEPEPEVSPVVEVVPSWKTIEWARTIISDAYTHIGTAKKIADCIAQTIPDQHTIPTADALIGAADSIPIPDSLQQHLDTAEQTCDPQPTPTPTPTSTPQPETHDDDHDHHHDHFGDPNPVVHEVENHVHRETLYSTDGKIAIKVDFPLGKTSWWGPWEGYQQGISSIRALSDWRDVTPCIQKIFWGFTREEGDAISQQAYEEADQLVEERFKAGLEPFDDPNYPDFPLYGNHFNEGYDYYTDGDEWWEARQRFWNETGLLDAIHFKRETELRIELATSGRFPECS